MTNIRLTAQTIDYYGNVLWERPLGTCMCDSIPRAMQMYEDELRDDEILVYQIIKGDK